MVVTVAIVLALVILLFIVLGRISLERGLMLILAVVVVSLLVRFLLGGHIAG